MVDMSNKESLDQRMRRTGETQEELHRKIDALHLHGLTDSQVAKLGVMDRLIAMQTAHADGAIYTDSHGNTGHVNFSNPDVVPVLTEEASRQQPRVVFELGTAHGLGSLSILLGHEDAEVLTFEYGDTEAQAALENFTSAGVNAQIVEAGRDFESLGAGSVTIIHGSAEDAIPTIPSRYEGLVDLVYVDHPKQMYKADLSSIVNRGFLARDAVVLADNTLSHLTREGDATHHAGISDYLEYVGLHGKDPGLFKSRTIPTFDGLTRSVFLGQPK